MNMLSSFTHPHVVTNLYEFLMLNTKDILKNAGKQTVDGVDSNNCLVLQNIFFCVQHMKET